MAQQHDHISMALFCDFENVALGVRDANYEKFDIKRVLEKLLLKGSIVVKKAYCDWERYKGFKAAMHEANFELIEIPHVRQSGKNSADIRLVVDALDLCYTKSHVNTFVIISGDSDFSPLVSKLRENAKQVIGVGVKQSTSDLLIANCDEFIFYDDLVRDSQRREQRRDPRGEQQQPKRSPEEEARRKAEMDTRRAKAVEMAAETYEALVTDRDEGGRIWASVLKEAIKRRNPGFNENYYGFRTFGNLLEDAQARGLMAFGRDEKSGTYVCRYTAEVAAQLAAAPQGAEMSANAPALGERSSERQGERQSERDRGRRGRGRGDRQDDRQDERHEGQRMTSGDDDAEARRPAFGTTANGWPDDAHAAPDADAASPAQADDATGTTPADAPPDAETAPRGRGARSERPARGRGKGKAQPKAALTAPTESAEALVAEPAAVVDAPAPEQAAKAAKPARKAAAKKASRARPRRAAAADQAGGTGEAGE